MQIIIIIKPEYFSMQPNSCTAAGPLQLFLFSSDCSWDDYQGVNGAVLTEPSVPSGVGCGLAATEGGGMGVIGSVSCSAQCEHGGVLNRGQDERKVSVVLQEQSCPHTACLKLTVWFETLMQALFSEPSSTLRTTSLCLHLVSVQAQT